MAETYTGKPCVRCDSTTRYKSNSHCVACNGKHKTPAQKRVAAAATRRWQERNAERVKAVRRAHWRSTKRFTEYGITRDRFEQMLAEQDRKCAGCEFELDDSLRTHIDHDHTTGKVRGLLCQRCNQALGLLRDSTAALLRLKAYLEKPRG